MSELSSFVDGMTKQLQRPISDLEDVREAMTALRKVCEAEMWIEATIGPVEETFALLNRHELQFSDGNAERIDTLIYGWKNLKELVRFFKSLSISVSFKFYLNILISIKC